jgi:hypothetical protein
MANQALLNKAKQAQIIYEDLIKRMDMTSIPTTFVADERRKELFEAFCPTENPFPEAFAPFLTNMRTDAVNKLMSDEKIPQTAAIAAVLSACSSVATQIGALRGDDTSDAQTYCDVAFAGAQAIRLFLANYTSQPFQMARFQSTARVLNALNGALHKYHDKDGRYVSFHAYFMSQQEKLVKELGLSKPSPAYTLPSTKEDVAELTKVISQCSAQDLEDRSFACGACGCMLRSREEWENTEVGKAVVAMPLIRTEKESDAPLPSWGRPNSRGPLSGIKVLDLTHIIAGPACSRVLAHYGADVLLVRRGTFMEQEQAMNEYDGWAGKHAINLDFNVPEQLERAKQLIREADVVTYSYQNGALDRFGLSEADIRKLNPNVIYANLMCFSDTVWKDRPGWAPCAEDITGLSVRNGSMEQPVNLVGVPLDYFPGFILGLGTLLAIQKKLKEGGGYKVTTSLTRGAQYLHECADLCQQKDTPTPSSSVAEKNDAPLWSHVLHYVDGCSIGGSSGFIQPATINTVYPMKEENLVFTDGNTGWSQTK